MTELKDSYDVVVIGGGAAGLNGALMLARSRRSVAVIDAGQPRNAPADAVHGLFAREGTPPAELIARGQEEVRSYGGEMFSGEVSDVVGSVDDFEVRLSDGRTTRARRILVTAGVVDKLPPVPGLAEQWGHGVVHCPYCHGWEVRDRAIGVLATSPMTAHQALLFRQLSDDVVVFSHQAALDEEELEKLAALRIRVIEGKVTAVEQSAGAITGVRLADGTVVAREAIAVATQMVARAGFLSGLGLTPTEHPSGMGVHIPAEAITGKTAVPGVWAAGNVTDMAAQVGPAAAAGGQAGAVINADLVMSDAARALAEYRDVFSPASEARVGRIIAGDRSL
ncbi:NAD(P)/FAD-dependent oxidoreductase [Ruania halotolerans]|uniref:NAD(P)/FAD-dependent oxidoreductase n=1 Tax=Ruania halotolerans TaxID=2897773 RepID=UPI001E653D34|nr:NAD(P)/FAD-dependent oxidoreductase [Ruania halotolerans]UFU06754.1 NAD(P)/FAD-dependent oxidoreductase [Ruania halotolerans]